ncbi:PTS glucose transporter subunit IIA [Salmonella enterica subsp. enterica]|nr:PTS glucose transporter subunit IIA [Salmonella enterica subsp. enterica]
MESDSGIELFVHFGIDTVELKGEGFSVLLKKVSAVLAIRSSSSICRCRKKSQVYPLTPVVISNMDEIKEPYSKPSGSVTVVKFGYPH